MGLSTIQWCDYTFNPWIGCRKVAPECANCYAEALDRNRYSKTLKPGTKENPVSHWGSGPRHRTKTWMGPVAWNEFALCGNCGNPEFIGSDDCRKCGMNFSTKTRRRPRVFCASLADWLDDENVPIEWFTNLLELIHATPNLDWLALTKRPQNWQQRTSEAFDFAMKHGKDHGRQMDFTDWLGAWTHAHVAPANVWIGVSAGADQQAALDIPARVHFLSCEPMLTGLVTTCAPKFDWIIFGGESGTKARPMDVNWIRSGLKMCRENGIAPFVKQLGRKPHESNGKGFNWPLMLKDPHGGDMDEWPEDLRIREFPTL